MGSKKRAHPQECKCSICKGFDDFEIPEHLMNEILTRNCVIFAGAGISTEKKGLYPFTFYEEICEALGYENTEKSFPEVMSEYCKRPNGRIELLNIIRKRFNNIKSFPELYFIATLFHKELSSIHHLDTIVTTNWDTYFEDETYSLPFVTGEDCSFWDTNDRKVLKIHGSINNLGSIILTKKDYDECLSNLTSGILGSILKTLLATKTIVFIGYSLRDYDFNSIYELIRNELNKFSRNAYIVSFDRDFMSRLKDSNFKVIHTDGTYFLEKIKSKLQDMDEMMYDEHLHFGKLFLAVIRASHGKLLSKYNYKDNPSIIYTTSYQDGMMHAIDRSLEMKKSGYYHNKNNMVDTVGTYIPLRDERLKAKKYDDVAYIDGYLNVHIMYFEFDKELRKNKNVRKNFKKLLPPLYYIFGYKGEIKSEKQFDSLLKKSHKLHKTSYIRAKRIIRKKIGDTDSMELHIHHPAIL